eukprot:76044-Prymnesium_polylepis.1
MQQCYAAAPCSNAMQPRHAATPCSKPPPRPRRSPLNLRDSGEIVARAAKGEGGGGALSAQPRGAAARGSIGRVLLTDGSIRPH